MKRYSSQESYEQNPCDRLPQVSEHLNTLNKFANEQTSILERMESENYLNQLLEEVPALQGDFKNLMQGLHAGYRKAKGQIKNLESRIC